ncbi:MAG: sulfatase-like hydrolase/transferase [Lachnospiraceae bacterium]|nr:sulfatase-like hydrolase/transferase [Lachnospiraceae bacterium]
MRKTILNKKYHVALIAVIIFFIFTVVLYAPLEMYLMNIDEFWFGFSDVVPIVLVVFLVGGILLFTPSVFVKKRVLNNYIAFVFGCAIAVYIQGNFLNLDVGVLNGAGIEWSQYRGNFIFNLVLWILFIIIPVVCVNLKTELTKKVFTYMASLITMMQLVSLIVTFLAVGLPNMDKQNNGNNVHMYVSSKNLFNLSEDENVVVLLCDMFDDRYFDEILPAHPELKEELSGFTQFTNSTSNYSTTHYSVGTLMVGSYFYNDVPFAEQLNRAYSDVKMFRALEENGYRLDIYTNPDYTPSDMWKKEDISNYIEGKEEIGNYPLFVKYLYQMVMCRYMPNILKPYIWMDGTEFSSLKAIDNACPSYDSDNIIFYNALKEKGIEVQNEEKTFKFIHLFGAHYPWRLNENIEEVDESETSELENAWGAFQIILEYIDGMKARGVYDNSAIIIMADHGLYGNGTLTNPVLLVKPKEATGELMFSNAPVSHHDFQPSVLYLAGLNSDQKYGKSFYDIGENEERQRLFYQYYLQEDNWQSNFRLIEYEIDSESNKRENYHLTDVEYLPTGEKIAHRENCAYCQSGAVDPIETEENEPLYIVHDSLYY